MQVKDVSRILLEHVTVTGQGVRIWDRSGK
jgi:hypothetical protein